MGIKPTTAPLLPLPPLLLPTPEVEEHCKATPSLDARDFGFDDDLMETESNASSAAGSPLPTPRSLACTSESTAVEQSEQKSPTATPDENSARTSLANSDANLNSAVSTCCD